MIKSECCQADVIQGGQADSIAAWVKCTNCGMQRNGLSAAVDILSKPLPADPDRQIVEIHRRARQAVLALGYPVEYGANGEGERARLHARRVAFNEAIEITEAIKGPCASILAALRKRRTECLRNLGQIK